MKKPTYLNVILTVIACLLGALVWMNLADRSVLTTNALAQGGPPGIPNAAEQRIAIRNAIYALNQDFDRFAKQFADGKVKVEISNVETFAKAVQDQKQDDERRDADGATIGH